MIDRKMENYIKNIITVSGNDADSYKINWIYLNED